jgi:hypothetical protein
LLIALALVAMRTRERLSPETFWLIAWSLGGLLVMSFVPSKRIDRIFPVVPPFCLLLATIISRLQQKENLRAIVDRCCAIAIVLGAVFTSGYAVQKIGAAKRENRDAYAIFGREVMKEVTAHNWRYGVVGGEEEGMLLYVRRTEFLEPGQAAADWNAGKLDAIVLPDDEIDGLIPQLQGEPKKTLTSGRVGRDAKRYFLLVR